MYSQFFGLAERPFDLTANPRFLFLSAGHREALSLILYGLSGEKGITLLTGEAGTGKTTLLRVALAQHRDSDTLALYLINPALSRVDFYEFLAHGVGLRPGAAQSKIVCLRELEHLLTERRRVGLQTALIIDEAQAIPFDILEEIRMLANLESATARLLTIVLTGQPELAARLNEPILRPLKQRIALRTQLPAFRLQETASYIAKRLRVAGGDPSAIFDQASVALIHDIAHGLPRSINVVCDNALVSAFALRQRMVTTDLVIEVCADLDLSVPPVSATQAVWRSAPPAPAPPVEVAPVAINAAPPPVGSQETVPIQLLDAPRRRPSPAGGADPAARIIGTGAYTVGAGRMSERTR
jgi:general secretion pathway protein A